MSLRVRFRNTAILFWILALIASVPGQISKQPGSKNRLAIPRTAKQKQDLEQEKDPGANLLRQDAPKGWVWVTQIVDLSQQLGGEAAIMTLDGEPVPSMQRRRITLGLILDNEGHIATRLIDVTPNRPPINISVRALGSRPATADFIGMDTVSGLCVLKTDDESIKAGAFSSPDPLPLRMDINLYGFHPNKPLNLDSAVVAGSPRVILFKGRISKALGDFRYNQGNPIYTLVSPGLTAVQDCSLILDRGNSIFGLAIYNMGAGGKHLVYPVSMIQKITQLVINTHKSISHGWLGATGIDEYGRMITPTSKASNPTVSERGVRITAVAPDSPAEIAGVRPKDILLNVNDRRIETYAQLASLIRQIPANNEISLRVKRGIEYKVLRAKLVAAPAVEPEQQLIAFARRLESMEEELRLLPPSDPARNKLESKVDMMRHFVGAVTGPAPPEIRLRVFYGMEVQPLTGQLMNYFSVSQGLLISNVLEGNRAFKSGLKAGDVITKIGDIVITDMTSLMTGLDKWVNGQLQITVSRRHESLKLNFKN